MTMFDDSRGFNDAPPPYQSVLQSSSEVNVSHTPDPYRASLSSWELERPSPPEARRSAATPSRWFPTSIFGLSRTARRRTATDVGHAAPLARVPSAMDVGHTAPLARVPSAEVRSTIQEFLCDLLSQTRPSEQGWLSLLSTCANTCNAQGLSFSALLQDPFVEGHLPVYWAVLKRPPPGKTDYSSPASNSDPDALVLAILDASLPINAASVADARLACVTVSDNALFVRLGQRYKAFLPRSGADRVLLGGSDPVDTVSIEEARGSGSNISAAFTVRFSFTQFQLRMRVSEQARIEFIARGRLWYLAFSVAGSNTEPPLGTSRAGEWLVALGLAENSSPTWVDGHLCIVDRSPLPPKHPTSGKDCNTLAASIPIKTTGSQLSPDGPTREVVVSLDKLLFGGTLQNDATSFVDADGTLNAVLEVKLQKTQVLEVKVQKRQNPDSGCIIC